MKKIFFITSLMIFAFVGCDESQEEEQAESGKVLVSYTNNTGKAITDVVANGLSIGNLKVGETTRFFTYEQFGADTGMPDVNFSGVVDDNRLESTNRFNWCGTEKHRITEGKLEISVGLVDYAEDGKFFNLAFSKTDVPSPLINTKWKLTDISVPNKPSIVDNYCIVFKRNGTVEFPLHCNISTGKYIDKGSHTSIIGSISFSDFYPATEKYCEGLSELETFVANYLLEAINYKWFSDRLSIECLQTGGIWLYFEKVDAN